MTAEEQAAALEAKLKVIADQAVAIKAERQDEEIATKAQEKRETEERHRKLIDGFEAVVRGVEAETANEHAAKEAVRRASRENMKGLDDETWTANMPEHLITNGGYTAAQSPHHDISLLDLGDQDDEEFNQEDFADEEVNESEDEEMSADDEEEQEEQQEKA